MFLHIMIKCKVFNIKCPWHIMTVGFSFTPLRLAGMQFQQLSNEQRTLMQTHAHTFILTQLLRPLENPIHSKRASFTLVVN